MTSLWPDKVRVAALPRARTGACLPTAGAIHSNIDGEVITPGVVTAACHSASVKSRLPTVWA